MFRPKISHLVKIAAVIVFILAAAGCASPTASIGVTVTPKAFLPFFVKEPTPLPANLPDLIVNGASITMEDPTCYDGQSMGMRVFMANIGLEDAGSFVVEIDGAAVSLDGLAAGASTSTWVPGHSSQPYIVIDAADQVLESDEENNVFNELLPIPTLPLPCADLTATPD